MPHNNTGHSESYSKSSDLESGIHHYNHHKPHSHDKRFHSSFTKISIRNAFISKVYAILAAQFAYTTAVILLVKYNENVLKFFLGPAHSFIFYPSLILTFITIFMLAFFETCRRTVPWNFILLAIFTICQSNLVAMMCIYYEIDAILYAAGLTFLITLSISLFSSCTKFDFTKWIWIMLIVLLVFFFAGFAMLFIHHRTVHVVYAAIGVVIFTIYLAIDTQLILGGREYEFSTEEYIFAVVHLYTDILYIFICLLRALNR